MNRLWLRVEVKLMTLEGVMFGKTFKFYFMMMLFAALPAFVSLFFGIERAVLIAYFGLCAAIASRIVSQEMLEWKTLIAMISMSSVVILIFSSKSEVRVFSEFVFWWGVFGIPLRATIRQINKGKKS